MYQTMSSGCGQAYNCSISSSLENRVSGAYARSIPMAMSSYAGIDTLAANPSIEYSKAQAISSMPNYSGSFFSISRTENNGHDKNYSNHGSLNYNPKDYNSYKTAGREEMIFNPETFISPDAPATQFVGNAAEIQGLVQEAFRATTGMLFPNDMMIQICSKEELKRMKVWTPGLNGFCINRKGFSFSNIFILEGSLDRVMLTIGHEIGHCLSLSLNDRIDEEAKAFAFSLAWAKAIRDNNIGNLAMSILPEPAHNGLHNVAFDLVMKLMKAGKQALDVYVDLVKKITRSAEVENNVLAA